MKIIDILTAQEIESAKASGVKILESQLRTATVAELKTLYPCITFRIQDPETEGHPAAHVLNELHLRTVTMDFYPDAENIDEAIALRMKEKGRLMPKH